jgi:two-component system, LytTR family, response regulator
MTCRAIIVDDEPLGRRGIAARLQHFPQVTVVGLCAGGREAIDAVHRLTPDLMFLDVEMPILNGFAVLEALGPTRPHTIFVTAYDRYAIQAFAAEALDYLVKPIDDDRFGQAVLRATERIRERRSSDLARQVVTLVGELSANEGAMADRFVVRTNGRLVFVRFAEIDWIEGAGDYVRLHANGRTWLHRQTLKRVERLLAPRGFVRIHRSTIVNGDRIRELRPIDNGDYGVVLLNGSEVRASRTYHTALADLRG